MESKLTSLVERIKELKIQYAQADGVPDRQRLGSPAGPYEVFAIEQDFSIQFPADYRAFLLMHNGWKSFIGDRDLLSTIQMRRGPTHDWLQELKHIQRQVADITAADGFVIEASENGTTITFIDIHCQNPNSLEVVEWSNEEFRRHESFTAYLEGVVLTLADLVKMKLEQR